MNLHHLGFFGCKQQKLTLAVLSLKGICCQAMIRWLTDLEGMRAEQT